MRPETSPSQDASRGEALSPPSVLTWGEIRDPGCYLHLPSGLLARIFSREVAPGAQEGGSPSGAAVKLSNDPSAPLGLLRDIARRHTLPVAF